MRLKKSKSDIEQEEKKFHDNVFTKQDGLKTDTEKVWEVVDAFIKKKKTCTIKYN